MLAIHAGGPEIRSPVPKQKDHPWHTSVISALGEWDVKTGGTLVRNSISKKLRWRVIEQDI